jgi:hypothetical protein
MLESGRAGNIYSEGPKCNFGAGLQVLEEIDDLEGSSQIDYLWGNGADNTLFGRGEWDLLYGKAGNDTIRAGNNKNPEGADGVAGDSGTDECEHDTVGDTWSGCP